MIRHFWKLWEIPKEDNNSNEINTQNEKQFNSK